MTVPAAVWQSCARQMFRRSLLGCTGTEMSRGWQGNTQFPSSRHSCASWSWHAVLPSYQDVSGSLAMSSGLSRHLLEGDSADGSLGRVPWSCSSWQRVQASLTPSQSLPTTSSECERLSSRGSNTRFSAPTTRSQEALIQIGACESRLK